MHIGNMKLLVGLSALCYIDIHIDSVCAYVCMHITENHLKGGSWKRQFSSFQVCVAGRFLAISKKYSNSDLLPEIISKSSTLNVFRNYYFKLINTQGCRRLCMCVRCGLQLFVYISPLFFLFFLEGGSVSICLLCFAFTKRFPY